MSTRPAAAAAATNGAPAVSEQPAGLPRLLARPPGATRVDLAAHAATHGALAMPGPRRGGDRALRELVAASGLRGRGGAGFPAGQKMAAVAGGRRAVVVGNASEGEPASSKDRVLLATAPHLVLDGLALAAAAVGATDTYLYVHTASTHARASLDRALTERAAARVDPVRPQVVLAPDRYVAGQETALVSLVNGGPAKPTFTPPRPFEKGVEGRPTLVSNVETLAHIALIARHGAQWFRSLGSAEDPGSALATLSGAFPADGVVELAMGTTLRQLSDDLGGLPHPPTAVLLGGYYGTWLRPDAVWDTPLGHHSLRSAGSSFGAGVVVVLDQRHCGLAESARVLAYLAQESAGQCGPCAHGLPAIAGAFSRLVAGRSSSAAAQAQRWAGMVAGRGACQLPDGAAAFAASALATFAEEVQRHSQHGPCVASRSTLLPVGPPPRTEQDWL